VSATSFSVGVPYFYGAKIGTGKEIKSLTNEFVFYFQLHNLMIMTLPSTNLFLKTYK